MSPDRRRRTRVLLAIASLLSAACQISIGADETSSKPPNYVPKLIKQGDVIRHPTWGVEITIPGFEYWKDNEMQVQANHILGALSKGTCDLNLTMFVENDQEGVTPDQCRKGYAGSPERLRKMRDVLLLEQAVSPITYSLFDQTWTSGGARFIQHQLYGYWTRGNLCFELHMSSAECDTAPFVRQAKSILESVRIGEDTGATLETVNIALHGGPDPLGWESHMLAGGVVLHLSKPPDPERARRLYEAALRMGGEAIPALARYYIEAGIGLAWLQEDKGVEAIAPLERGLKAARQMPETEVPPEAALSKPGVEAPKPPSKSASIEETIDNLMCAHSLAGNIDDACAYAREVLTPLDPKRRKEKLDQYRKDKQVRRLLKSECYRALLEELKSD